MAKKSRYTGYMNGLKQIRNPKAHGSLLQHLKELKEKGKKGSGNAETEAAYGKA